MKNLTSILLLFSCFFCLAQEVKKQNVYLHFDSNSKKTYLVEVNGKNIKEKFYTKGIKKDGEITFYIDKEMFLSNKKQADTCSVIYLKNIKISNIEDLKKDVDKINPLYPYKVYPNLFLIEKINDSTIVKYKVRWEYYIE
ncbi:hypothetical protein H2O64_14365 [Kordia sp. YSTF-M3]|uniref:Ecotin n=1 Tax=Kordia aestuariivivens TaxID=2759037 RepID=A0ABR7QBU3_9FLAO|nr:hypothetical protein [Kordia aestuariivivens]MBC8755858.1 hypothetical protein [Kordia aestuariivivens]